MPSNRKEKMLFAFLTVLITVPAFVFYCTSYENGGFNVDIIKQSWIFITIELVIAFICAYFIGSPLAIKLALKKVNPKENSHVLVETSIVCATVSIMCPLMSFIATILYDGIINVGLNNASLNNFLINFIPYWLQKVVLNFPFALITQLFFIQPLVRMSFRKICNK